MNTFKRGDQVEHIDGEPGRVGTITHVYASGQLAFVVWPDGPSTDTATLLLKPASSGEPAPFRKGDRVRLIDSIMPAGTILGHRGIGSVGVLWDGPAKDIGWCEISALTHAEPKPTPFRRGDQVEHVDNAPGFIMTVAADQYTSGAVLVEWPDGSRHDYQARFLKHAAPMPTIHDATMGALHKKWNADRNKGETKTRAKTLREAGKLIDGDRANDYDTKDDATGNFNRIAQLWSPILGVDVTATQVALCLTQLKVARIIVNPTKQDSWIDAAGYIALGSEIAEQENK